MLIYKIVSSELWSQATAEGFFEGAPVDLRDGFIHFSTAGQVRETAARHFAGQTGLLLVAVEADRLGADLRWEPSRGGASFPHLYGNLPLTHVVWAVDLPLAHEGTHHFPDHVT